MQALLVASYFGSESLERDVAIELCVAGEINLAHAALTEFGADFVTTESCSRNDVHFTAESQTVFHLKSRISTTSVVTVARTSSNCLPSRDHARCETPFAEKLVNGLGAPPSRG